MTSDYYANLEAQEQLDGEEAELKVWEERFVQAGLQIVDCVTKRETGRWLPAEILGIVGGFFEGGWDGAQEDMVVDVRIASV